MAPLWMQRWGLEWLFRLWFEPRRLWRRYLATNAIYSGTLTFANTKLPLLRLREVVLREA